MIVRELLYKLGFSTDTSGAKEADKAAEKVAVSSKKAGDEIDKVGKAATKASVSQKRLAEVNKTVAHWLDKTQHASARARADFARLERRAFVTAESLQRLRAGAQSLASYMGPKLLTAAQVGATAFVALGYKVLDTAGSFEKLRTSLNTSFGGEFAGGQVFERIRKFASETPFEVEQLTQAVIKLKNLGLDPGNDALRSYGNTASAMGKSLDMMIEAVADATTGEFERLKEFGIRAASEGDRVSFTFQGVTTTVGKNAAEIETYLRSIGDTKFAGAMETQMGTLGGVLSNLKDRFTEFLVTIAEMGPMEEFKALLGDLSGAAGDKGLAATIAGALTSAIRTLRKLIAQGLLDTLKRLAEAFATIIKTIEALAAGMESGNTIETINNLATSFIAVANASLPLIETLAKISGGLSAIAQMANLAKAGIEGVAGTKQERGAPKTISEEFGAGGGGAMKDARDATKVILREQKLLTQLEHEGVGASSRRVKESQARLREAQTKKKRAKERAQSTEAIIANAQQGASTVNETIEKAEASEFGDFDKQVKALEDSLGVGEGKQATPKQQAKLDKAIAALAEGKSVDEAKKVGGIGRGGGGRGGRRRSAGDGDGEGDLIAGLLGGKGVGGAERSPTLGTTINNVTVNAPTNVTIEAKQKAGENTSDFAQRVAGMISVALGKRDRAMADHIRGAVA